MLVEVACEFGYFHSDAECRSTGSTFYNQLFCTGGGSEDSGEINPIYGFSSRWGTSGSVLITPNMNYVISCDSSEEDQFIQNLYYQHQNWVSQNLSIFNWFANTVCSDNSQQNKDFINWSINFLKQNPEIHWEEFHNLFIDTITPQDLINELKDYPCAKGILQELPNLSNDIANSIRTVFQNNNNYNVIFRAKTGLGNVDGETFSSYSTEFGTFRSVIYLNDQVLQNATKEYILITMYHEVVHAFLDFEKYRLGDTNFQNEYPYVVVGYDYANNHIVNRFTFLPQHNQLGAFLTQLENILLMYNPNLPTATAKAMAKAGITTMTAQESQLNKDERTTLLNNYKGTKCP